jgi:DNA-binding transcriptional ArsR family regulator
MGEIGESCEDLCISKSKAEELKKSIPEQTAKMAALFKALGDETRSRILYLLSLEKDICVCHIAEILDSSVSNISHHLRLLRAYNIVKYRKIGKNVLYSLDDEHVLSIIKAGFEHVSHTYDN